MEYLYPTSWLEYSYASMTSVFRPYSTDSIKAPRGRNKNTSRRSIPFQSCHTPLKPTEARRSASAIFPAEIGDTMFFQIKNLRSAFPSMNSAILGKKHDVSCHALFIAGEGNKMSPQLHGQM